MDTKIAKAYVQLVPSTEGFGSKIKSAIGGDIQSSGDSAGESFGSSMVSKIKGVIAAAGIGAIVKQALDVGADLEQNIGGIETLFGDSADKMKEYAQEAYKTAGISANDYMEQSTSFAASLLSSLGGDTEAAAEAANNAVIAMADNANKMGTDLSSIQNAYQGFAKQNYTMLDNLKLGYGGTKEEMERLLADATELSGVEYDIDNLSDVYSAISVIQDNLGITGTTAKEAATTFSGSMASMKASFNNLLGDLTTGADISDDLTALGTTIHTFIVDNLVPMLVNIIEQLPTLLKDAISFMIEGLNMVSDNADTIIQTGLDLVGELIVGLLNALPAITTAIISLVKAMVKAFLNYDWKSLGTDILTGIKNGIIASLKIVIDAAKSAAKAIFDAVKDFFQIGSPSKLMANEIGKWIPAGISVGIEDNMGSVLDTMDQLSSATFTAMDPAALQMKASSVPSSSSSDMSNLISAIQASPTNVTVTLQGDARKLFKVMQSEATNYNKTTGQAAFS